MPLFSSANTALDVGAKAPALTVTTHLGKPLDLGDLYKKGPVAVYFYPKSDTPGCTKQACNLRDNFDDLKAAGVEIIGVSADAVVKQKAFVEKYTLPFTIVADPDRILGQAFGIGSYPGGAFKRQTFLVIDGKIAWRDLKATPVTQSADLMAALEGIQSAK